MTGLPSITCVMTAFNYGRFVQTALESVISQEYPPELLDVILVDDGSTDDTVEKVREMQSRVEGRVNLIQQHNAGVTAATRTALAHATGELIAMCDADDEWLPGRVSEQAEIFASNANVSLCYGDMQIVDYQGTVIKGSLFADRNVVPREGRILEELVDQNFVPNSTLMFRARDVAPYPDRMPVQDYWLVVNAAAAGDAVAIRRPVANYRTHGENMGHDASGDAYVNLLARELLARRLIIRELFRELRPTALVAIARNLRAKALWAGTLSQNSVEDVLNIRDDERALALAELERGHREQDPDERLRTFARAASIDPLSEAAQKAMTSELLHRDQGPRPSIRIVDDRPPSASVVIAAFNRAQFLPQAIDSALGQDLDGSLEVIVVDDGSSDETAAVMDRYGDRIRAVRRPHLGFLSTVDHGLGLVRSGYVGLLDADDEWPPDRLSRHIRALRSDPTLGLVHGDMEIINQTGELLHPSFFERERKQVESGRVLGSLLAGNFVSGGGSTFRAELLPAVHPISSDAAYPDWWLAACIAAVANIGVAPGISNRYRQHGDNMGLGTGADEQPRIQRGELPWRQWMLTNLLEDDSITVAHLSAAFIALRFGLRIAATLEPAGARGLLVVDHERAASMLGSLPAPGAGAVRSRAILRALAADPFDGATAIDLEIAMLHEAQFPQPQPSAPLIALETRSKLSLAWFEEVLANRDLLRAFAEEREDLENTTLVILTASDVDPTPLIELVNSDSLLGGPLYDITLLPGPVTTPAKRLLAHRATTRLSALRSPPEYQRLPLHPAVERAESYRAGG